MHARNRRPEADQRIQRGWRNEKWKKNKGNRTKMPLGGRSAPEKLGKKKRDEGERISHHELKRTVFDILVWGSKVSVASEKKNLIIVIKEEEDEYSKSLFCK